jgi:DNA-binding PadR family transcriptional regulator
VRTAVLQLLVEEPMHGYQLMRAIADRTDGRWEPSPGAMYPTINQLADEGLVVVTDDAGRKLVTLTDEGRARAASDAESRPDPFAGYESANEGVDLRGLLRELHSAAREVGRSGSETQRAAAARILTDARRSLYLLLADDGDRTD